MKRWEIENYLFDKEVLRRYCGANGLEFDEVSYDAMNWNLMDDDLKAELSRIRNFCGIKGSISADSFKVTLSAHVSQDSVVYQELEACIFDRA